MNDSWENDSSQVEIFGISADHTQAAEDWSTDFSVVLPTASSNSQTKSSPRIKSIKVPFEKKASDILEEPEGDEDWDSMFSATSKGIKSADFPLLPLAATKLGETNDTVDSSPRLKQDMKPQTPNIPLSAKPPPPIIPPRKPSLKSEEAETIEDWDVELGIDELADDDNDGRAVQTFKSLLEASERKAIIEDIAMEEIGSLKVERNSSVQTDLNAKYPIPGFGKPFFASSKSGGDSTKAESNQHSIPPNCKIVCQLIRNSTTVIKKMLPKQCCLYSIQFNDGKKSMPVKSFEEWIKKLVSKNEARVELVKSVETVNLAAVRDKVLTPKLTEAWCELVNSTFCTKQWVACVSTIRLLSSKIASADQFLLMSQYDFARQGEIVKHLLFVLKLSALIEFGDVANGDAVSLACGDANKYSGNKRASRRHSKKELQETCFFELYGLIYKYFPYFRPITELMLIRAAAHTFSLNTDTINAGKILGTRSPSRTAASDREDSISRIRYAVKVKNIHAVTAQYLNLYSRVTGDIVSIICDNCEASFGDDNTSKVKSPHKALDYTSNIPIECSNSFLCLSVASDIFLFTHGISPLTMETCSRLLEKFDSSGDDDDEEEADDDIDEEDEDEDEADNSPIVIGRKLSSIPPIQTNVLSLQRASSDTKSDTSSASNVSSTVKVLRWGETAGHASDASDTCDTPTAVVGSLPPRRKSKRAQKLEDLLLGRDIASSEEDIERIFRDDHGFCFDLFSHLYPSFESSLTELKSRAVFVMSIMTERIHNLSLTEELLFECCVLLDMSPGIGDSIVDMVSPFGCLCLEKLGTVVTKNGKYDYGSSFIESAIDCNRLCRTGGETRLLRTLCAIALEKNDITRALIYHCEMLQVAIQDGKANEFVYVCDVVSRLLLELGVFKASLRCLRISSALLNGAPLSFVTFQKEGNDGKEEKEDKDDLLPFTVFLPLMPESTLNQFGIDATSIQLSPLSVTSTPTNSTPQSAGEGPTQVALPKRRKSLLASQPSPSSSVGLDVDHDIGLLFIDSQQLKIQIRIVDVLISSCFHEAAIQLLTKLLRRKIPAATRASVMFKLAKCFLKLKRLGAAEAALDRLLLDAMEAIDSIEISGVVKSFAVMSSGQASGSSSFSAASSTANLTNIANSFSGMVKSIDYLILRARCRLAARDPITARQFLAIAKGACSAGKYSILGQLYYLDGKACTQLCMQCHKGEGVDLAIGQEMEESYANMADQYFRIGYTFFRMTDDVIHQVKCLCKIVSLHTSRVFVDVCFRSIPLQTTLDGHGKEIISSIAGVSSTALDLAGNVASPLLLLTSLVNAAEVCILLGNHSIALSCWKEAQSLLTITFLQRPSHSLNSLGSVVHSKKPQQIITSRQSSEDINTVPVTPLVSPPVPTIQHPPGLMSRIFETLEKLVRMTFVMAQSPLLDFTQLLVSWSLLDQEAHLLVGRVEGWLDKISPPKDQLNLGLTDSQSSVTSSSTNDSDDALQDISGMFSNVLRVLSFRTPGDTSQSAVDATNRVLDFLLSDEVNGMSVFVSLVQMNKFGVLSKSKVGEYISRLGRDEIKMATHRRGDKPQVATPNSKSSAENKIEFTTLNPAMMTPTTDFQQTSSTASTTAMNIFTMCTALQDTADTYRESVSVSAFLKLKLVKDQYVHGKLNLSSMRESNMTILQLLASVAITTADDLAAIAEGDAYSLKSDAAGSRLSMSRKMSFRNEPSASYVGGRERPLSVHMGRNGLKDAIKLEDGILVMKKEDQTKGDAVNYPASMHFLVIIDCIMLYYRPIGNVRAISPIRVDDEAPDLLSRKATSVRKFVQTNDNSESKMSIGFNDENILAALRRLPLAPAPEADVLVFDHAVSALVERLGCQNVLFLVQLLMLEQPLLLIASPRLEELLIYSFTGLLRLIRPLQWQHSYIPLLPLPAYTVLLSLIRKGLPFIVGTYPTTMESVIAAVGQVGSSRTATDAGGNRMTDILQGISSISFFDGITVVDLDSCSIRPSIFLEYASYSTLGRCYIPEADPYFLDHIVRDIHIAGVDLRIQLPTMPARYRLLLCQRLEMALEFSPMSPSKSASSSQSITPVPQPIDSLTTGAVAISYGGSSLSLSLTATAPVRQLRVGVFDWSRSVRVSEALRGGLLMIMASLLKSLSIFCISVPPSSTDLTPRSALGASSDSFRGQMTRVCDLNGFLGSIKNDVRPFLQVMSATRMFAVYARSISEMTYGVDSSPTTTLRPQASVRGVDRGKSVIVDSFMDRFRSITSARMSQKLRLYSQIKLKRLASYMKVFITIPLPQSEEQFFPFVHTFPYLSSDIDNDYAALFSERIKKVSRLPGYEPPREKNRWCVLDAANLTYYKSRSRRRIKDSIAMDPTSVRLIASPFIIRFERELLQSTTDSGSPTHDTSNSQNSTVRAPLGEIVSYRVKCSQFHQIYSAKSFGGGLSSSNMNEINQPSVAGLGSLSPGKVVTFPNLTTGKVMITPSGVGLGDDGSKTLGIEGIGLICSDNRVVVLRGETAGVHDQWVQAIRSRFISQDAYDRMDTMFG